MKYVQIAALVLLAVAAIILCVIGAGPLAQLQSGFLGLLSPLSQSGNAVKNSIGNLGKDLMTLDQLQAEYNRLLSENKQLRAENNGLRDLQTDNDHLRSILGYRERSAFHLIPAAVLGHDAQAWWSTIKINRGSKDGIAADMPVITDRGLVGKTTAVSREMSEVILITDENCKVAAKVEGTKDQGICAGARAPEGELKLSFLNKLADLQPGQKVYTAGVSGGVFPSGIALGTVKNFHARELDGEAVLEPAADLGSLEEVFVVTGAK
ncbi:MAG: rod shape-determining protein MreC [bacterium]